jgi:predicted lipid-binding transport protein (Tim44 family)
MQNSFDITTLIFLGLAVFVIWRLRSVLGQKTGHEQPPFDPISRREPPARPGAPTPDPDNVVRLPGANGGDRAGTMVVPPADRWKGIAEPGSRIAQGLDEIARAEPQFDGRGFMDGSKAAYEMIVTAFAQGDRRALKDLLSREVYDGFEAAIRDRELKGETAETRFVSIDKAEITGAELRGRTAHITVRFVSQLISVTRDRAGNVTDGSPDKVTDVTDVWTFARDLSSRDPNWKLVATEAGH